MKFHTRTIQLETTAQLHQGSLSPCTTERAGSDQLKEATKLQLKKASIVRKVLQSYLGLRV